MFLIFRTLNTFLFSTLHFSASCPCTPFRAEQSQRSGNADICRTSTPAKDNVLAKKGGIGRVGLA